VGYIYLLIAIAGLCLKPVFAMAQCSPGTTSILVTGSPVLAYGGDGMLATDTSIHFNFATLMALDSVGDLFISDMNNYRVRKISASSGIITTIAGDGINGNAGDGV
jgi:hypothetical protein